ncbi:outer membrane lipoprotein carrier protein LolA [Porticoccus sp. W117]|uniref:LolA family protein n=1 Tax=Porticoccus sp. W117 TaxID=3054777 RepID=UPI002596566F|nr:outer membrane lipoprotein carrier protein LolA [Porticoccus sp. W117]MDM3869850.1 outer membrane lipoprotein carrier protein LolA [Porticoccus sp. W117]
MRALLRVLVSGMLALLMCFSAVAQTAEEQSLATLQDISQRLHRSDTVRGEFVQHRYLKILSRPLTSTGDFYFQQNLGARWRVVQPYPSTIHITAEGKVFTSEQGQPMAEEFGQLLLALLLIDSEQLSHHFQVKATTVDSQWSLTLTPHSDQWQQVVREISVNGDRAVRSIEIHENGGDRTVVSIDNVSHKPLLSDTEKSEFLQIVGQPAQ